MPIDLGRFGYRTRAQRVAELKLVMKNAQLDAYQRKVVLSALGRVLADLENCAGVRERMLMAAYKVSGTHRDAVAKRKEKEPSIGARLSAIRDKEAKRHG